MAFVRSKTVNGMRYFQVVRNYREDGKHKQEMLCHLGPYSSIEDAIIHHTEARRIMMEAAGRSENEAEVTKAYLFEFYGIRIDDETQVIERETELQESLDPVVNALYTWEEDVLYLWEQWSEETRRLYRSRLEDFGPVEGRVEYIRAKRKAREFRQRGNVHAKKLDKLLHVRAEYF